MLCNRHPRHEPDRYRSRAVKFTLCLPTLAICIIWLVVLGGLFIGVANDFITHLPK